MNCNLKRREPRKQSDPSLYPSRSTFDWNYRLTEMHTNTTQTPDTESLPVELLIESHHSMNAGLIRLNCFSHTKQQRQKQCNSSFTVWYLQFSLIAQAPTSLLLPKSTSSVALAKYHHNRSQDLVDCQSQRKRTNNKPNLLTELLPNRLTTPSTLSTFST
jgi:hypothetical protein